MGMKEIEKEFDKDSASAEYTAKLMPNSKVILVADAILIIRSAIKTAYIDLLAESESLATAKEIRHLIKDKLLEFDKD